MQAQDIQDVLELQVLFADHGLDTAGRNADVLAALIGWKTGNGSTPAPAPTPEPAKTAAPRTKAGKADNGSSDDSDF